MGRAMLSEKEFKEFFDDVVKVVSGAKGAHKTLLEVLEAYGLSPEYLPGTMDSKVMPLLELNIQEQEVVAKGIAHNCGWCPTCGLCAACGGLNAGSLGALSASSLHILD